MTPTRWIFAILLLAVVVWRLLAGTAQPLHAADISPGHDVVMFSTAWCGYCDQARHWFEQEGIAFIEIDVESTTEAQHQFRQVGGRGVPLTFIGDKRMTGFSAEAYGRALENL